MRNGCSPWCYLAPGRVAPGLRWGRVRATGYEHCSATPTWLLCGYQLSVAGIAAGLYGKLVGASDYQLNLHPPEEDTQDVLDSLDSVMAVSMRCTGVGIMSRVCVCVRMRVCSAVDVGALMRE